MINASYWGKPEIVELLIKHGADVNTKVYTDYDIEFPLYWAAIKGRKKIIKLLLDNGARFDPDTKEAEKIIRNLIYYDKIDVIEYLLKEKKLSPETALNNHGYLSYAATEDKIKSLKYLLKNGVDVNEQDKEGNTPLHNLLYCNSNTRERAEILINNGAFLEIKNKKGETPLNMVRLWGTPDFTYLISKGADVNTRDNKGMTPLHKAVIHEEHTFADYLIDSGAKINIADNKGKTPLDYARMDGNDGMLRLMEK